MACCDLKGMLTFLVLWIINKEPANGASIAREIEKRKGCKPSPGTIYPVLKDLKEKGLVTVKEKEYHITDKGHKELHAGCSLFKKIFYDVEEICRKCD
ncbi:MAG: PadR family transcriptional regulator [Candidatus Woesearchaeota archaeon]|nr:PadR family transcriptional regulator [Candidatus Woesearchaeota archaeon]